MTENMPQMITTATETNETEFDESAVDEGFIDHCPDLKEMMNALQLFELAVLDYKQYGYPMLDQLIEARAAIQTAISLRCINSRPLT